MNYERAKQALEDAAGVLGDDVLEELSILVEMFEPYEGDDPDEARARQPSPCHCGNCGLAVPLIFAPAELRRVAAVGIRLAQCARCFSNKMLVGPAPSAVSDPFDIIAAICAEAARNGFYHSPRLVKRSSFDLTGFKGQASDITGVDTEYVKQTGPGISGDDYHGTIAHGIGAWLFVLEY